MSDSVPPGWTTALVSSLAELHCGQSPPAAAVNTDGKGIPYITGPEQLRSGRLLLGKWTTQPKRVVPDGCIFVTVKGAGVGTTFPGVASAIGRDVYAIRPHHGLNREYLHLALDFDIRTLVDRAAGLIPGLTRDHLLTQVVPVPPALEQQRIVEKLQSLLSRVSAARKRLERVSQILRLFRQAVLAAACEGSLTEAWREVNGHPGADLGSEQLPANWDLIDAGACYLDARYGTSLRCESALTSGVPVLRVPNIEKATVDLTDLKFAKPGEIPPSLRLSAGDVIICRTNGSIDLIGKAAVVPRLPQVCSFASYLIRLRLDPALLTPDYFHIFLTSPRGREQLMRDARTSAGQYNLNLEILRNLIIPHPPINEQQEIVRRVKALLSLADAIEYRLTTSLKATDKLPQTILARAFTGELVPTEAELSRVEGRSYETATELLVRIRSEREALVGQKGASRRTRKTPTAARVKPQPKSKR